MRKILSMTAEIISIGDEILIGQTQNTNAGWIGSELGLRGIKVGRVTTIGDQSEAILAAVEEGFERVDLVITTGGLGPTKDDITKQCLADYFHLKLARNADVEAQIRERFARAGRPMPEAVLQQAVLPAGCALLPNSRGTAPGMWFERSGKVLIALPGVPHEMMGILNDGGFDHILEKFTPGAVVHHTVLTQGIGESQLAEIIAGWEQDLRQKGLNLAYLPSAGMVKLRITATGRRELLPQLTKEVAARAADLEMLIAEYIFGTNGDTLPGVLGELLRSRQKTVATAESCTGGKIAAAITSVPGASDYFVGSVVAYNNAVKSTVLQIDPKLMEVEGVTSRAVAGEMARQVRQLTGADFAVATTGIAGPGGGTEACPVGTIFMAVAGTKNMKTRMLRYGHSRSRNIEMATNEALNWLRKEIIAGSLE